MEKKMDITIMGFIGFRVEGLEEMDKKLGSTIMWYLGLEFRV